MVRIAYDFGQRVGARLVYRECFYARSHDYPMELRHLRYFVAAAETENVSKAAGVLHVSQPALSRQIRDLEDELGFKLFERSAKSVQLTAAGQTFLTEARAVLQRAEEAVKAARAVATGAGTELHVGYAPSPTVRITPAILRAFQARMPKVRVKLHDLSTQEMISGLRDAKLQVALMVKPNKAMLSGLVFEELAQDQMCVAVAPSHEFARLRSTTVSQTSMQPLVIFSRQDYPDYFEYLESLFAPLKARPRVVEEHESAASLITAIETGTGVAIVPESFSCSAGPRLKLIPISPAPPPLVIGAVYARSTLGTAGEDFLEAARQAVKAL